MINYNQSFIALLNQFINKMSNNNDCLNKPLTQKLSSGNNYFYWCHYNH